MSPHTDAGELLPCPFCGNELYRSPRAHNPKAYCVTEDCYGKRMSVVNLDDPVCVAMWNTRQAASQGRAGGEQSEVRSREALIEQCAVICDKLAAESEARIERNPSSNSSQMFAAISNSANDCAAMIRDLKSAPERKGSLPSGENDPSVTLDCSGADTAAQEARNSGKTREPTPQWQRRWPHDQPNGWNLDSAGFLAQVQANPMMWLALGRAKYLEMRIDTRDGGFNLYDRDSKPLNPDDVIDAIAKVQKDFGGPEIPSAEQRCPECEANGLCARHAIPSATREGK